jgi:hypothetical protein
MTWDSAITTLEAHMTAAGTATAAALSSDPYLVQGGEPGVPPRKLLAWWYDGLGANPYIAETLTDAPFGDRVMVRAYIPVATRAGSASHKVEMELRDLVNELFTRLEGDRTLGDNCLAIETPEFDTGWLSIDNAWWRTASTSLVLGFTDEVTIAR